MTARRSLAPELYASANRPRDAALMARMREQDLTPISTDGSLPRFTVLVGHSPFTMPRGWEYYLTTPFEGATYIATVAHNAGYPTRIVDVRFAADPLEAAYRQIVAGTDVLGISSFEDNYPFTRELIQRVKEAQPDLPVVVGGSLITAVPHVFMADTRTDVAVISEGELTILELLDSVANGSLARDLPHIRGIWYRDGDGQVQATAPRGQMPDLDSLPRMRLDLWPQARGPGGLQPQIITSYSRGCRMDCSFCFRTTPCVSAKSPETFDRDLRWLTEQYGANFLFMADLTFNQDTRQVRQMCEVMGQYDLRFTSMCRCSFADEERLTAMKAAGCDIILYGVESLGEQALKEVHKPTTENISLRALHRTGEAGIRFGALLIVGLPGESPEVLDHMASWAEEFQHVVRVKYLQALPGTRIYNELLAKGTLRSEVDHLDWLSTEQSLAEDEFLNVNGLPEATMRQAFQRMYDAYQPGPVMRFDHWPDHFEYFHPNADDGSDHALTYAGAGWRADFSSAGPPLYPGSERFTLEHSGAPGAAKSGGKLAVSGAQRMGMAGTRNT